MKYVIKHENRNRIRFHLPMSRFSFRQADILEYYLLSYDEVIEARIYERTADAVIIYSGERARTLEIIRDFSFESAKVSDRQLECSGRELNAYYRDRIVTSIIMHYGKRLIVPAPIRRIWILIKTARYIIRGLKTIGKGGLKVELLDSIAITAAIATKDYKTASSVMFLLKIGDTLEEWTHKKSVDDLARRMSLNIDKVWLKTPEGDVFTDSDKIVCGDKVVVHMGNIIPFDGKVCDGEALVNQASLTGEAEAYRKAAGSAVFAGTVLEEGELTIEVSSVSGSGRFDKIVRMIEESEKMKSTVEGKAERLADRLVPYTLAAAGLTYLLSRNVSKAISVLMVDYSCALKMAMPISVLSAIKESADYGITVKGGRFMEEVAAADTIVFDKTGTLTMARPMVAKVVSFNGEPEDELLRQAACLEEHFPHSVAKAVVDAAIRKGLTHEEMHSKVEYIVAHGIASSIDGKKAVIGSYHFVFEDEKAVVPDGMQDVFDNLPAHYSHLYFAKGGKLYACILIEDPMREEASEVVEKLKASGFEHIVMMTGDSERTAASIARAAGIDEYYSEVLPEDKASYVERAKKEGEEFTVTTEDGDRAYAFTVAGITRYSPSLMIFMDIDECRELFGDMDDYYNVVLSDHKLDIPGGRLYSTLTKADVENAAEVFLDQMMSMIITMSAASAVIFVVVMYLMMKMMLDKASFNIALVKIFGFRNKEVRRMYLDGNFYIVAGGTLISIPICKAILDYVYPNYLVANVASAFEQSFPFYIYVIVVLSIMVLYFIINNALVGRIKQMVPAQVLKNRE